MLSNGSIYLQLETHVFYQYKLSKFGTNFFKKRVIFLPKKKNQIYGERDLVKAGASNGSQVAFFL